VSRVIAYGLPALAIVTAFVLSDLQLKGLAFSAMARLGDASYSLYLVHLLVLRVVLKAVTALVLSTMFEVAVYVIAAMALSIICAILTYDWFERPTMWRLSGRARSLQRSHPTTPGTDDTSLPRRVMRHHG
jgi:exopolysaccharide production protein ExoZ